MVPGYQEDRKRRWCDSWQSIHKNSNKVSRLTEERRRKSVVWNPTIFIFRLLFRISYKTGDKFLAHTHNINVDVVLIMQTQRQDFANSFLRWHAHFLLLL